MVYRIRDIETDSLVTEFGHIQDPLSLVRQRIAPSSGPIGAYIQGPHADRFHALRMIPVGHTRRAYARQDRQTPKSIACG